MLPWFDRTGVRAGVERLKRRGLIIEKDAELGRARVELTGRGLQKATEIEATLSRT